MTPSPEQSAIIDRFRTTSDNLMVEAVAGSGKTTLLAQLLSHVNPIGQSVAALAFGKDIAATFTERFPIWVNVGTGHKFGLTAWRSVVPKARIDNRGQKCRDILKAAGESWLKISPVCRLVDLAKSNGLGTHILPDTDEEWHRLITHHDLTSEHMEPEEMITLARRTLDASNEQRDFVDFGDMLYLPLKFGAPFAKQHLLLVDEAQDINAVQLELITQMLHPTGRLIAVGDPMQAIFAFRGADTSAMTRIRDRFAMHTLPLSVSWRCSRAVVREAQRYYNTDITK